jgi:23S rRNA (guanosine2251-2'-O)-methyltransferase
MPNEKANIHLILHNVRSCYNVGSIFRTSDAAGVEKIYLCGYTPTPEYKSKLKNQNAKLQSKIQNLGKIEKTALGAEKTVSWESYKQTWRLLEKLQKDGVKIIALEQTLKSKNIFEYHPPIDKPIAIIAGHERKGLSKKILEYVDECVEIPMHGKKESLNVSVAVGIALYQLIK